MTLFIKAFPNLTPCMHFTCTTCRNIFSSISCWGWILATQWECCIIMTRWKSYLTLIVALMVICSLNCGNAVFWLKPIIECVQVIFQPNFRFCIKNILMRMYNIETVGERLFINRLLWMIFTNSGNAVRTLHNCKHVKILFDFNCGSHGYLCSYTLYGWNMLKNTSKSYFSLIFRFCI